VSNSRPPTKISDVGLSARIMLEDRNTAGEMATWGPQRSTADECSLTLSARIMFPTASAAVSQSVGPPSPQFGRSHGPLRSREKISLRSTAGVARGSGQLSTQAEPIAELFTCLGFVCHRRTPSSGRDSTQCAGRGRSANLVPRASQIAPEEVTKRWHVSACCEGVVVGVTRGSMKI